MLVAMTRTTPDTVRLTLRLDLGGRRMLGHGKVRLLEGIAAEGSIAAAGGRWGCRIGAHGGWWRA